MAAMNSNAPPYYPPGQNPNAEEFVPEAERQRLEDMAEMDALLEEINVARAANMPQRKNRKNRKSRKGRKSRRNGKSKKSRRSRK